MFCAIAFPKISWLYLSEFTLARSMYSLGNSDMSLNILRLLMTKYLFSLCEHSFFMFPLFGGKFGFTSVLAVKDTVFTYADTDHNQSPP